MTQNRVTATEFQTRAGRYLDESAKAPIFITRHGRPVRALIDIEEYERLKKIAEEMDKETEKLIDQSIAAHRGTLEKLALK